MGRDFFLLSSPPSQSSSCGLVLAQSIREAGTRTPGLSVQMVRSAARAPLTAFPGQTILWVGGGAVQPLDDSSI